LRIAVASLVALFAAGAGPGFAQSGGQGEFAIQGYYVGTGSQLTSTTGAALKFEQFLPGTGLLRGSLEAYGSQGLQPADNYLQLHGWIWQGLRWNIDAGDFRAPGTLLPNPFANVFFPEISARGVQLEAGDSNRSYTFFYGHETLLAGPRIPFRIDVPQSVMGAAVRQKFGRLETGVRLLFLEKAGGGPGQSFYFPAGRDFRSAANLTGYVAYRMNDHFRWYGEATIARAESADATPPGGRYSYFFGPAWESPRLTVRLNYMNLSRTYLPLAGYWTGDRKGPFGELLLKPLRRLELYSSANRYESSSNSSERLPSLRSAAVSAGASVLLPWKWNASGQYSTTDLHSSDPVSSTAQYSRVRQWSGTLSRSIGPHTLRVTERDMGLLANGTASRERSTEAEDLFHLRHFLLGASVRAQQDSGTSRRNTVYARGSAQLALARFSAYGFFESGRDLANQTVFSTNTTNSAVAAASFQVTRRWSVRAEAFRSRLVSEINPDSLFVQANQGMALNPLLNRFGQWSLLFRVSRSFQWGAPVPAAELDQFTARRIPLTGTVEGAVYVLTAGGRQPAPGVVIQLESGRSAISDSEGQYRFAEVGEGAHVVSLDLERLPAEYNPGPNIKTPVAIAARKIARADFELYSLGAFVGQVKASSGSQFESLEGILIQLKPGERYTTTAKDGSFAFYNLPENNYEVRIAAETLPAAASLKGDAAVHVVVRSGSVPPSVQFEIERLQPAEKPVRRVIDKILVPGPVGPPENPTGKPSGKN
jgi:hypothetical protein